MPQSSRRLLRIPTERSDARSVRAAPTTSPPELVRAVDDRPPCGLAVGQPLRTRPQVAQQQLDALGRLDARPGAGLRGVRHARPHAVGLLAAPRRAREVEVTDGAPYEVLAVLDAHTEHRDAVNVVRGHGPRDGRERRVGRARDDADVHRVGDGGVLEGGSPVAALGGGDGVGVRPASSSVAPAGRPRIRPTPQVVSVLLRSSRATNRPRSARARSSGRAGAGARRPAPGAAEA